MNQKNVIGVLAAIFVSSCASLTGSTTSKQEATTDTPPGSTGDPLTNMQVAYQLSSKPKSRVGIPSGFTEFVDSSASDTELKPASAAIEPRFNLAAAQLQAKDFFDGLVADSDYSVIYEPAFSGPRITATLKQVTLLEALEAIQDLYGYHIDVTGRLIRVESPGLRTRTYELNYLSMQRAGSSQTLVTSGQLQRTNSNSRDNGKEDKSDGGSNQMDLAAGTLIRTNSQSRLWQELTQAIGSLADTERGESIMLSPESGAIIARAHPGTHKAIREFLKVAHRTFHGEVLIEAKILEITLTDNAQVGINWGALSQAGQRSSFFGIAGGADALNRGASSLSNNTLNIAAGSNAINALQTSASGGALFLSLATPDFSGVFEFLETQGDVKVLSSPRIATVNNQKAVIKVGSDEFFVTGIKNNTTTGDNPVNTTDIELTPFFSGVALDVTPRVYENNEVILHVHPTVSEVTDSTKEIVVADQVQRLPLATSRLRESDSVIRARSGQIVVIGGLIREANGEEKFGAPLLSRLPLIGYLFGQSRKTNHRSELVILLRPTVINSASDRKTLANGALPH